MFKLNALAKSTCAKNGRVYLWNTTKIFQLIFDRVSDLISRDKNNTHSYYQQESIETKNHSIKPEQVPCLAYKCDM
jgi:hypothetical protein